MANRKRAPREVEERHRPLLAAASAALADKRQEAWEAELLMRGLVKFAFDDGVTASQIQEETGLSLPRLYQIKHEELDKATMSLVKRLLVRNRRAS
jgi:hypothetical protein